MEHPVNTVHIVVSVKELQRLAREANRNRILSGSTRLTHCVVLAIGVGQNNAPDGSGHPMAGEYMAKPLAMIHATRDLRQANDIREGLRH